MKIWSSAFLLCALALSCCQSPSRSETLATSPLAARKLEVMPFHKTDILAGRISLRPRIYDVYQDGTDGRSEVKITNARYYLGDRLIGDVSDKTCALIYDLTYWTNGSYPFRVEVKGTDGSNYSFITNTVISNVTLTVRLLLREPKPAGMEIYLAGSATVLLKPGMDTEWDAAALKMKKISPLEYTASFRAGLGETVFMEFTLGSWATKARDAKNELIHVSTQIKKPDQVFKVEIDNWGKTTGFPSTQGWNIGFTGEGRRIQLTWSHKKNQPTVIHYAYQGEPWRNTTWTNARHCSLDIEARWGRELQFVVEGIEGTNRFVLPARGLPFTFLKVGDIHNNQSSPIPALMARESNISFLIDTGDLVMDGLKGPDWNNFYKLNQVYLSRFLYQPAMGNHEYESPFYQDITGKPKWYSFTWENTYFICLDNNNNVEAGSPQTTWLEQELKKAARYRFRIVYMHIPPYSSKKHGNDRMMQTHLVPLFDKYGVHLVFLGHEHGYEVSYPMKAHQKADKGTVYVISAGGGQGLYDLETQSEWSRIDKKTFNYMRVTVHSDRIELSAVNEKGQVFDQFLVK